MGGIQKMTETTNYHLKKPDDTDPTDQRPFNENADILDEELAKRYTKTEIDEQEAVLLGEVTKNTAALIELVDSGTKNKLSIGIPTSVPTGLTCVRSDDGTYTVSGTLTSANSISFNIGAIEGDLVLSGCPEGGGDDTYLLRITKSGSQIPNSVDTGNGSGVFTMDGTGYALGIRLAAGTYNDLIFKPMICTKADWDISQSYQPYRPNTVGEVFGPGTEIIGTDAEHQDLNSYTELGVYFCRNSTNAGYVDNKPVGGSGFRLTVENISGTNTFRQTFIKPTDPSKIYVRHYSTSTWSAWYVFEGTSVT